jgi:hypothetical protein
MRHLRTVIETFQLTNIGLAVALFSLEELEELSFAFGDVFEVELRLPDGTVWQTDAVVPLQFVNPWPGPKSASYSLVLPDAIKEQVPRGTDVFFD